MPTDQVRIRSLYAGLNRTIIWFGLLVAAAWLFATLVTFSDAVRCWLALQSVDDQKLTGRQPCGLTAGTNL
jgi:hypothetical protein